MVRRRTYLHARDRDRGWQPSHRRDPRRPATHRPPLDARGRPPRRRLRRRLAPVVQGRKRRLRREAIRDELPKRRENDGDRRVIAWKLTGRHGFLVRRLATMASPGARL